MNKKKLAQKMLSKAEREKGTTKYDSKAWKARKKAKRIKTISKKK